MALFTREELINFKSENAIYESKILAGLESLSIESLDEKESCNYYDEFDIFLSHSYKDKEIIPMLKAYLEKFGYKVYVDWISDKCISRNEINKKTAQILQNRMKQSKCLFYATSQNSVTSRWMPWELGYFDGIKDKMVAILPIKTNGNNFEDDFKGEEYLGLYYYVDKTSDILYIQENSNQYVKFDEWLNGKKP